jgi:hypothetical protein
MKAGWPQHPFLTQLGNHTELIQTLAAQEKGMIEAALKESRGRVFAPTGAAAKLGMHSNQFPDSSLLPHSKTGPNQPPRHTEQASQRMLHGFSPIVENSPAIVESNY